MWGWGMRDSRYRISICATGYLLRVPNSTSAAAGLRTVMVCPTHSRGPLSQSEGIVLPPPQSPTATITRPSLSQHTPPCTMARSKLRAPSRSFTKCVGNSCSGAARSEDSERCAASARPCPPAEETTRHPAAAECGALAEQRARSSECARSVSSARRPQKEAAGMSAAGAVALPTGSNARAPARSRLNAARQHRRGRPTQCPPSVPNWRLSARP